ncbi:unnamed protein product [Clonostachys rosea f. rosea IK726]|uniref:Uncharacterized protein n=2 Tax=Bionectria ochroleuca TaxID=29856 RepID=A0A0B7JJD8_BIOOC|nr:unnamed protein product [Clonostachys rosea f. rosea IK726]
MWLINVHTYALEEFLSGDATPPYAILSHMWSRPANAEVTFTEMRQDLPSAQLKPCFAKISKSCEISKSHMLDYVWIDTCCIDKRSSADLSEAINSMYNYYRDSVECLVYLSDVEAGGGDNNVTRTESLERLSRSRWFLRGWTLQELLAPRTRYFYDQSWNFIPSGDDLLETLARAGNLSVEILKDQGQVSKISIGERMAMASRRLTTRAEDMAYCLMGIFNVNIPVLYGEGGKSAFRRLQLEIMSKSFDQTLFAWRADLPESGLLASSPSDFINTPRLRRWLPDYLEPFTMTNIGLSMSCYLLDAPEPEHRAKTITRPELRHGRRALMPLQCDLLSDQSTNVLCLYLQSIPEARFFVDGRKRFAFRRVHCSMWKLVPGSMLQSVESRSLLVLEDDQFELIANSRAIRPSMQFVPFNFHASEEAGGRGSNNRATVEPPQETFQISQLALDLAVQTKIGTWNTSKDDKKTMEIISSYRLIRERVQDRLRSMFGSEDIKVEEHRMLMEMRE